MVKILCDLSWIKRKPNPVGNASFSLHAFLSSPFFAGTISRWFLGIQIILKVFVNPALYFFADWPEGYPESHVGLLVFASTLFIMDLIGCYPIFHTFNRRYWRREYVDKKFRWFHILQNASTYVSIWEFVVLIVYPLILHSIGMWTIPQLSIGSFIMLLNILALYSYYNCDFALLTDHRDHLVLVDCYEKAYEPVHLTILESTPTCITLKNISNKWFSQNLEILRTVFNFEVRYTTGEVDINTGIPPGAVFKVITTEYKEAVDEGEYVFVAPKLRSFGPRKGDRVVTSVTIRNWKGDSDFCDGCHLKLTQEYASKPNENRVKTSLEPLRIAVPVITRRPVPNTSESAV